MGKTKKALEKLRETVKAKGLKNTKQRELIFTIIIKSNMHLGAEDIHKIISKKYQDENIGIATIYRALTFLEESKLINSISLDKDSKKFETNFKSHHDHLICVKCDKIIEFMSDIIEDEQEKVAKENGFSLLKHTMYLYGTCDDCQ